MASSNANNKGNDYEEGTTMQLLENGIGDTNTHKNAASQLCDNQPHQRSGYFSGTTNPAIRLQDSLWQISDSIGFRFRLYNPKCSEFEVEQNSNSYGWLISKPWAPLPCSMMFKSASFGRISILYWVRYYTKLYSIRSQFQLRKDDYRIRRHVRGLNWRKFKTWK